MILHFILMSAVRDSINFTIGLQNGMSIKKKNLKHSLTRCYFINND